MDAFVVIIKLLVKYKRNALVSENINVVLTEITRFPISDSFLHFGKKYCVFEKVEIVLRVLFVVRFFSFVPPAP